MHVFFKCTEAGVLGMNGEHVPRHVIQECTVGYDHARTHVRNVSETIALATTMKRNCVTMVLVQVKYV
jgi:hypothetical protein